jgi:hypothetical protein
MGVRAPVALHEVQVVLGCLFPRNRVRAVLAERALCEDDLSLLPRLGEGKGRVSSRQVRRFEPLVPGSENLIRDHAGFDQRKALVASLAEKHFSAIECPTNRRGPVVYGAAVPTEIDALASFTAL